MQSSPQLEQLAHAFSQLKCLSGSGGIFHDWQNSVVRAAVVMLVAIQKQVFRGNSCAH